MQGTHQVAQKSSTMTFLPRCSERVKVEPSVAFTVKSAASVAAWAAPGDGEPDDDDDEDEVEDEPAVAQPAAARAAASAAREMSRDTGKLRVGERRRAYCV
jgi:hypothetical protein